MLVAKVILLLAGLFVPGAALARALNVPRTVATCFAGSALSLYVIVLGLQLTSIRISLGSLATALLLFVITALGAVRLMRGRTSEDSMVSASFGSRAGLPITIGRVGIWTLVYVVFWVAVLWRAWHEPLAGPDVEFRWSFLAEQMLQLGSLDFYPPRSADDFYWYFWVESIPPGVSSLHAWAYACAGGALETWTVPAVILQLWSIHELLWRTAERIGGLYAARFACLAAAACPFLTWSVLIGQETGLTALSIVGIAFSTHAWRETHEWSWAALAGVFAALGAAAREYGLVFPAIAIVVFAFNRADRRAWLAFGAVAAIGIVWPLRTWILTGNPFYSLPLGGMFPINERFVDWIEADAGALGEVLQTVAGWRQIGRYVLLYAPVAFLGWLVIFIAAARGRRHAVVAAIITVLLLTVWASSVRYTNGGPFYSLRVASPAFALGTLATGICLAALTEARPRSNKATLAALTVAVVALLPFTLALPQPSWRTAPRDWPAFASAANKTDETVRIVLRAIASSSDLGELHSPSVVLADSPGYQRRFRDTPVWVIPLWSPQVDWLFDRTLPPAEAVRRWRQSGVRHLILTKWKTNLDFFNARSRWAHAPFKVRLIGETSITAVFAIEAVE